MSTINQRLRELAGELASDIDMLDNGFFSEHDKNRDAVIATAREIAELHRSTYDGPDTVPNGWQGAPPVSPR